MKRFISIFIFTLFILAFIDCHAQDEQQEINDVPILKGPYLGQTPPGLTPEIFAPGFISKKGYFEYPCSFSSDMTEMYYGVNMFLEKEKEKYILCVKRKKDGSWSLPEKISFTGFHESEPILTPDNSKLFFSVRTDLNKNKPHDIWYVNREKDGWSKPIKLNSEINSNKYEYYASMSQNNKLYFTREGEGIFTAECIDNDFVNVKKIDPPISKFKFCGHPFIAPNESYLIFDSRERGGFGEADLYISFKENGQWGSPINLGEKINTREIEMMPIVTPDGKYLFFCRKVNNERDIYWVEFDIEKIKISLK